MTIVKMKRVFKRTLFTVSVIAVLGVVIAAVSANSRKPAVAVAPVCTVNAATLLGYINAERSKVGSPALTTDVALSASSRTKLNDMVTNKYYGHDLTDGTSFAKFIQDQGVKAAISEDINSSDNSPEQSWAEFKNSPAHYASLTNPSYTRVGIATQCTDYVAEKVTGPDDNAAILGQHISDLTVVHLAATEPVAPVTRSNSQPSTLYIPPVYTPPVYQPPTPTTTNCTYNDYGGYFTPTSTCTTR